MLLSASPSHNVHAACLPVCKGGADFGVAVAKHKEPTFRNILWPQLYFARRGRGVEGFCFGPGSPGAPANKNAACSLWRGFLFQMIFMVPHELCGTNAIITLITYTLRPSFVPVWQWQQRNTLIAWKFVREEGGRRLLLLLKTGIEEIYML